MATTSDSVLWHTHPETATLLVSKLPPIARKILEAHPYNTFVTGGWCRDTLTGVTPKDIDILSLVEPSTIHAGFPATTSYRCLGNVWEYIIPDHPPIQILKVDSPFDYVKSFDFTINKSILVRMYSGDTWEFYAHPNFMADLQAKRLSMGAVGEKVRPTRTLGRILRMMQKGYFPDSVAHLAQIFAYSICGSSYGRNHFINVNDLMAIMCPTNAFKTLQHKPLHTPITPGRPVPANEAAEYVTTGDEMEIEQVEATATATQVNTELRW